MNILNTIRYMGIKTNLLSEIIPAIKEITRENGVVLDLMAGSNVVSYALKEFFTVYTNDVQKYSYTISKAVIENQTETISGKSAHTDLFSNVQKNLEKPSYNFFEKTYSNTYFSQTQCKYIDSIRFAIDKIENEYKKNLYLFALMCAMCKVQSTPGHFAQYMPKDHPRIIPLQQMDIYKEFLLKCDNYSDLYLSNKKNKSFCCDYRELLKTDIGKIDTIYLDSPYTQEQYSRFYHILETLVKYDSPTVNFKAKYRDGRFQSDFCYKSKVKQEFENIMSFCKEKQTNLVISYSNKGVLESEELEMLCKEYFKKVVVKKINYKHSTQGKGNKELFEIIFSCSF